MSDVTIEALCKAFCMAADSKPFQNYRAARQKEIRRGVVAILHKARDAGSGEIAAGIERYAGYPADVISNRSTAKRVVLAERHAIFDDILQGHESPQEMGDG